MTFSENNQHQKRSVDVDDSRSSADYSYPGQGDKGSSAPRPRKRKQSAGFYIAVGVAIVAVIAAGVLLFTMFGPSAASGRDPNASMGQLDGKTQEEVETELNRQVEEGMFNISIASTVDMENGSASAPVRIENVPNNHFLMKVEIVRNDTNETIYTTGMIEPNHHVEEAKFDVALEKGTYSCTAVFYAYDIESEVLAGQAAAEILITVQN